MAANKLFYLGAVVDEDEHENGAWDRDMFVSAPSAQAAYDVYAAYCVLTDGEKSDHLGRVQVFEVPSPCDEVGLHAWRAPMPFSGPRQCVVERPVSRHSHHTATDPLPGE